MNNLYNININPFTTEKANQYIGESLNYISFHYELSNLVVSNNDEITINNGQETTEQIIEKHIAKYSEVFDALS